MKSHILSALLTLCASQLLAQEDDRHELVRNKKFTTYQLAALMSTSGADGFTFENCEIVTTPGDFTVTGFNDATLVVPAHVKGVGFFRCTLSGVSLQVDDPATRIHIERGTTRGFHILAGDELIISDTDVVGISFRDLRPGGRRVVEVVGSAIGQIVFHNDTIGLLRFESSRIRVARIDNCHFPALILDKRSSFYDEHELEFFSFVPWDSLEIRMGKIDLWSNRHVYGNYKYNGIAFIDNDVEVLSLHGCTFHLDSRAVFPLYHNRIADLIIFRCRLPVVDLYNTSITRNLSFNTSSLTGLNILQAEFPEADVSGLSFEKLSGRLFLVDPTNIQLYSVPVKNQNGADSVLRVKQDTVFFRNVTPYRAQSEAEISNDYFFSDLINTYSKLYQIYKIRGDIESANKCYAEMKDLATAKLKLRYKEDPGFTSFFRWQLANIVKVYTNHGTDPALAIAVSFWLIVFFAVFYFFFPSDWDVKSKSNLIENYRTFIQKNDAGYVKPFFVMAGGIGLSFLNAMTLSLNAYTTLGFGNIPTHGAARYACVIEGFIGWFMLSIFTVALINQVLA